MKLLTTKYKSNLSGIILAIYLLTFVAGILHYHNFDFFNTDTVETEKNLSSNHFQTVNGRNYDCIIQQNLTSLQTTLIVVFNDNRITVDENIFFQNSTSQFYVIQVHMTDNLLRAPPTLS
jgi:hypothetical protein